jgi:hypothetical protein
MKWCSEMAPGLPEAVSAVTIVRVLCAAAWKRTLDRIEVTCFWSGFFASPIAQRIRLGPCTCLARPSGLGHALRVRVRRLEAGTLSFPWQHGPGRANFGTTSRKQQKGHLRHEFRILIQTR